MKPTILANLIIISTFMILENVHGKKIGGVVVPMLNLKNRHQHQFVKTFYNPTTTFDFSK